MTNERSAIINVGGTEYELLLTTRATKEISARFGGLEKLGETMMNPDNFDMAAAGVDFVAREAEQLEIGLARRPAHELGEVRRR